MSKSSENVPKLRFPGFTGPWEQRELGEVVKRINTSSDCAGLPRVEFGDINPEDGSLNKTVEELGRSKAGIAFSRRDVLYGKLRPYLHNWLFPEFDGIALGDFWVLRASGIDASYLYRLVQSKAFDRLANISSGSKMPRADWGLMSGARFSMPASPAEQQAIGSFFSDLDNLITLRQRELDHVKLLKRGLLQKLFPKDGSDVPEIRFPGFTGPWEQRKLGEVADIIGGATPDTGNPEYWDGDIDWYSPAELGDQRYADFSQRRITQLGFRSCSVKLLPANKTILFTSRAGIGKAAILRRPACTNQGFQSLVVREGTDVYFLYSMSSQIKYWAERRASGSTFLEVSGRQLARMDLRLPAFTEQQAIGSFFRNLDDLITLRQRELDHVKLLKKALLQQMFV